MDVASKGFLNVSLPEVLARRVDAFVAEGEWGFNSRAEVVSQAVREYLERHGMDQQAPPAQEETQEGPEKGRVKRKH